MSLGVRPAWMTRIRCVGPSAAFAPSTARTAAFRPGAPPTTSPAASTYDDAKLRRTTRAPVADLDLERNQMLRDAFRAQTPEIAAAIEQKLADSPFVPTARDYPSPAAASQSLARARKAARVQVGLDMIWQSRASRTPAWTETFRLLKNMTSVRSERPKMGAVRVVLPGSWDVDVASTRIEYLQSRTGLMARLHMSPVPRAPSAFVLRGQSSVLAQAVDELIAACKDIEVFKLGAVGTLDYETTRLWPSIEDAPDRGLSLPAGVPDSTQMDMGEPSYWIEKPYEQTPMPASWTQTTFAAYIAALVQGRLRPHLAQRFYGEGRKDGNLIDTDGIRADLIVRAFKDPLARDCVTPSVLKQAIGFLARRGGHRAMASDLLTLAEEWGVPTDVDIYNVLLDGYVASRDTVFFHKVLKRMEARYLEPNAETWLRFLSLVQRDDERRQIIVAMYELGLLDAPDSRRGIAAIMASHDTYAALKAGKKLDKFMADQTVRYGKDWLTVDALKGVLGEFFLFHGKDHSRLADFKLLMEMQPGAGRCVDTSTVNLILECCAKARNWTTALWALGQMPRYDCVPDHQTYKLLVALACSTHYPHALGVVFFYAVLGRKLRLSARRTMMQLLTGQHPDPFWSHTRPNIFSKQMAQMLDAAPVGPCSNAVAGAEAAILTVADGYQPDRPLAEALDVAVRTMDRPRQWRAAAQRRDPPGCAAEEQHGPPAAPPYVVRLRHGAAARPKLLVRLNAHFRPETMMRVRAPRRGDGDGDGDAPGHEPQPQPQPQPPRPAPRASP